MFCTIVLFALSPVRSAIASEQVEQPQVSLTANYVSGDTLALLSYKYAGQRFRSFRDFITELYFSGRKYFTPAQHAAMGEFAADGALTPAEREQLFRLLGLYAQLKYGGDAIRSLGELLAIPTFKLDGVENHQNRNFKRFHKKLRRLARKLRLKYRNVDNRVIEISLEGGGDTVIGLHTHADVKPAIASNWVLESGIQLEPFRLTRIDGKLYGRGSQNNKNAIVAVMYALRVIKEEKVGLWNDIKLLVDTTRESSGTSMAYYLSDNPTPEYNIALDGYYPAVIAEQSLAVVRAVFPVRAPTSVAEAGKLTFSRLRAAAPADQPPAVSQVRVLSDQPVVTLEQLNRLAAIQLEQQDDRFNITSALDAGAVLVSVRDTTSAVQSGVGSLSRLLSFVHQVNSTLSVKQNHITDLAAYVNWGIENSSSGTAIGREDSFERAFGRAFTSGSFTLQATPQDLVLDVSVPISADQVTTEIESKARSKIAQWQARSGVDLSVSWSAQAPTQHYPEGAWVNALLDISSESLGLPRGSGLNARVAPIHSLPNGVEFGLSMPGQQPLGQQANEFKTVDQFLVDMQIVTEMIIRLGQMNRLQ